MGVLLFQEIQVQLSTHTQKLTTTYAPAPCKGMCTHVGPTHAFMHTHTHTHIYTYTRLQIKHKDKNLQIKKGEEIDT